MLLSTNNVLYQIKASELKDTKASMADYFCLIILKWQKSEKNSTNDFPEDYSGYMIYFFENGKVAKIKVFFI